MVVRLCLSGERSRAADAADSHSRGVRSPRRLFELKHDGFRALAHVDGHHCRLVSRRGHVFRERNRRLRRIMPRIESRLLYVDHVEARGVDLFREVCRRDLEGTVAKWKRGRYHSDGQRTSWLKIRNPQYSQAEGRHASFGARKAGSRSRSARPVLSAELQSVAAPGR